MSLRRLFPVDAAFLATADPATLLFTDAYAEEPLDTATPLFLDNEFGSVDVNKFATLATSSRRVASLDQATRSHRLSSPRYRDIMRPLGLGDELRAALIVDQQCWGFLCLHREDHHLGFTASEAALVARISHHLAAGLRQAVLLQGPHNPDGSAPGVVLLSDDLNPVAMTAEAEHLLSLLEAPVGRSRCPSTQSQLHYSPWNKVSHRPSFPAPGFPQGQARGWSCTRPGSQGHRAMARVASPSLSKLRRPAPPHRSCCPRTV